MTKLSILFTLLAATAGCGGGNKSATTTPPTTEQPAPPPAVLGVTELKFYQGDRMMLHLLADGTLQVNAVQVSDPPTKENWKPIGTITADGKITGPDGKSAQLQPDGSLKLSTGEDPGIKIDSDVLVMAGKRLTIDTTGNVLVDGAPIAKDTAVRFEGVTDAASRRTALLLVALTVGGAQKVESGGVETK